MHIRRLLGKRTTAAAVVVAVLVALVLAAVETLGQGASGGRQVQTIGTRISPADLDSPAPSRPLTHAPVEPVSSPNVPVAHAGAPPARPGTTGASSSADPHRLARGGSAHHPGAGFPPDATPGAAAAGTEPGEMGPLADLPPGWAASVHHFNVGAVTRSYLMVRPSSPGPGRLPVVVILHGRNETPAIIEHATRAPSMTGHAILVFPAGYGRSWDAGGCCGIAHTRDVNDVTFLTDVVHRVLASQHDAAADKVYMVGFSNGGRMAYTVACSDPGLLAGIVAVEAVPVDHCAATAPLPVMIVASTRDPLLTIYNGFTLKTMGGYLEPTVESTVARWRHIDGCSAAGTEAVTGLATVDTWTHCVGAGRVAYALYKGGAHAWPNGAPATAARAGTPSAGVLLWGWLQRGVVISRTA